MSVKTVKAEINGRAYDLIYNSLSGKYEAVICAPYDSSFSQPGGYFPVKLTAENSSGISRVIDSTDEKLGLSLRLFVKEMTLPTIGFVSHEEGASFSSLPIELVFLASDAFNGQSSGYSGVDINSISVFVDSQPYGFLVKDVYDYGFTFSVMINEASEGVHNIRIIASDNDGNQAQFSYTIKIDKTAPALSVLSPYEGEVFGDAFITVSGISFDDTDSERPFVKVYTNDGFEHGDADFVSETEFEKEIFLIAGNNIITVTSTDKSGNTSVVTRNVFFDNAAPVFKSVTLSKNNVTAGEAYVISVEVE